MIEEIDNEVKKRKFMVELLYLRLGYNKSVRDKFTEEDYNSEELFRKRMIEVTNYKEETPTEEQKQKLREKFGC